MNTRTSRTLALAVLTTFLSLPALAAERAGKTPERTDKAIVCAQEADTKALAGAARSRYVDQCVEDLGTLAASAARPSSQQEKMKTCNAEARRKELHGDERRSFMSACLKG